METKHTPGSWRIAKPGAAKVPTTIPIVYDAKGNAIAHVLGGLDAAHLIAAAPEMLEALKLNFEHSDLEGRVFYCNCPRYERLSIDCRNDDSKKHSTACAEARAAIAKAEGK